MLSTIFHSWPSMLFYFSISIACALLYAATVCFTSFSLLYLGSQGLCLGAKWLHLGPHGPHLGPQGLHLGPQELYLLPGGLY